MSNAMFLKFKMREQELLRRIDELEDKVKQLEIKENTDDIQELIELIESNNKSNEKAKNKLTEKIIDMEEEILNEKVTRYIDDIDYTIIELACQVGKVTQVIKDIEYITSRTSIYYGTYRLSRKEKALKELLESFESTQRMLSEAKYYVPRKSIVNPKHVDNPNTYTSIIEAFHHVTPKGNVYVYNADMEQIGIIPNSRYITEREYIAEDVIHYYLGIEMYSSLYNTILNSSDFKKLSMEINLSSQSYFEFQYS